MVATTMTLSSNEFPIMSIFKTFFSTTSSTRSSSFHRDDNLVSVSNAEMFRHTLHRLSDDDEDLTALNFRASICHAFDDSTIQSFVALLRSTKHLKTFMFDIGPDCDLSSEGTSILANFIETSPTIEVLGLEGDLSERTADRMDILLRAASRNPKVTQLRLSSVLVKSSTLLEAMRDPSLRYLSVTAVSLDVDDTAATSDFQGYSLQALVVKESSNSLVEWLLAHIDPKSLKELNISLLMLPLKIVTSLSEVLVTTNDLKVFNLKVAFAEDGPAKPMREPGHPDDATSAQLTEIMKGLAQNKTIQNLSIVLPVSDDNDEDFNLLETHIRNNPNLVDVGTVRCSGFASYMEDLFKTICKKNEVFLQVIEMDPPVYCPKVVWPFLLERSLTICTGHNAIFQQLRMHFFNDFD